MATSPRRGILREVATAALLAVLLASAPAASAERIATVRQEAYACTSFAAWREFGLASFHGRGPWPMKYCPERIPVKAKVTVIVEEDDWGAAQVRWRGKVWFVDGQRLE